MVTGDQRKIRRAAALLYLHREPSQRHAHQQKRTQRHGLQDCCFDQAEGREITLLPNLRNWQKTGERYITEQIYVHSKMVIVDDGFALMGSLDEGVLQIRDLVRLVESGPSMAGWGGHPRRKQTPGSEHPPTAPYSRCSGLSPVK